MSIRLKFFALFLALSVMLAGGIWAWNQSNQAGTTRLLQDAKRSRSRLVEEILRLKGAVMANVVRDYSTWTDLIGFVERPNDQWAKDNIDNAVQSFQFDGMWTFDRNGKLVRFNSIEGDEWLKELAPILAEAPARLPKETKKAHFFVRGKKLVEIRMSTIVKSGNFSHAGRAYGYLYAGMVWDTPYCQALSKAIGADVSVESRMPQTGVDSSHRYLEQFRELPGPDGRPVGWLHVSSLRSPIAHLERVSGRQTIFVVAASVVVLGLFAVCTAAWVAAPLRTIVTALTDPGAAPLDRLMRHRDEFGQIAQLVARSHRDRAELKAREAYKTAVLETSMDAVLTVDSENVILDFNCAAEEMFRITREEAIGRDLSLTIIPERFRAAHRSGLARALEKLKHGPVAVRVEIPALRTDGSEFPAEISITSVPSADGHVFTGFIRDLSESHRLKEQLVQSRKMESLGQLAAGVAHEINTPMQYIKDNAAFLADAGANVETILVAYRRLREAVDEGVDPTALAAEVSALETSLDIEFLVEEMPRASADALKGIERVRQIVRTMRQMAHPGSDEWADVDLSGLVDDAVAMVRNETKNVADLDLRLAAGLNPVRCHPGELAQAVVNIVVNAAYAISKVADEKGRGRILVETFGDADKVGLRISDTGGGIPPAIREKVFDPFFTTKPVGEGTGQGLAMVFAFVQRSQGQIVFEDNVGGGTVFTLTFPLQVAVAA